MYHNNSQDTLNVLKNKYFGDLSKLTVPQMKSVIIRQTMAPIKTKKGVRMDKSYFVKIINKMLSDEPCVQDFRDRVMAAEHDYVGSNDEQ